MIGKVTVPRSITATADTSWKTVTFRSGATVKSQKSGIGGTVGVATRGGLMLISDTEIVGENPIIEVWRLISLDIRARQGSIHSESNNIA